ncbi:MAG: hypothetical protein QOH27_4220, partial [Mycobacterium sp.]|nr:hypothetical protein [Mycobacterium sp.]
AIIEVTSTNICGSDLHLYEVLGAFMKPGDVLGHEPMGVVREVGDEVSNLKVGDRVVIPFQIPVAAASCAMGSSTPRARPPWYETRGWVRPCSAIPSSTVRFRAGRPSCCGYRKLSSPTSRCRGATGLAVRVPVRRVADGVTGGEVRRRARRWIGHCAGVGTDRGHGGAHPPTTWAMGDRGRSGPGTTRASRRPRHSGHRPGSTRLSIG